MLYMCRKCLQRMFYLIGRQEINSIAVVTNLMAWVTVFGGLAYTSHFCHSI